MAIRITGMYSGLDTEAIISELVSAQSVKKNKYVKDQTKLSWKMDAWKALNTKIYNFYTNTLDNMRWQASYMKKATKVSNSNAISVIAGNNAVNGVQSVRVAELAKTGKLTGRDLSLDYEGTKITGSTKLKDLGITDEASFDVTVGGKTTSIKIDGNTKISDVVKKLQNAGLNASFDAENHRFFISSKETGEKANFTITANNQNGLKALESLGLLTKEDMLNDEYAQWAKYKTDTEAYNAVIAKEVNKRAASYKKANDTLAKQNADLEKEIEKLKDDPSYAKDEEGNVISASELYDKLYGTKAEDSDERTGGLKQKLDQLKADIADAKAQLDNETLTEDDKAILQDKIDQMQEELDNTQAEFNEVDLQYSTNKAIEDKQAQINANNKTIEGNQQYYNVDLAVDDEGNTVESVWGSDALTEQVRTEFDKKVDLAVQIVEESRKEGAFGDMKLANKINGQDAEIYVDNAKFTSSSNDFNINGMTITVYETTGENEVTITTSNDVDGVYDMIKNFFTEYNSLINEMSALYNADSAKGYDPLLSEEKAEMADSEIEEWEKKIKDSLLRRDATLGDLTDAIKTVMLQGATVNGKTMYLSDFGINTLGYFNAGDNEKSAYHIYGDSDDASVKGEDDILKKMIASDPDAVMNFFSKLSNNLYDKLSDKMRGIKDASSAFTVYNDKTMQKEYDAYKNKIAKEEDKLNALMDKWYEKFSRMETAMAKLQSKNSGLAGMLGGNQ